MRVILAPEKIKITGNNRGPDAARLVIVRVCQLEPARARRRRRRRQAPTVRNEKRCRQPKRASTCVGGRRGPEPLYRSQKSRKTPISRPAAKVQRPKVQ